MALRNRDTRHPTKRSIKRSIKKCQSRQTNTETKQQQQQQQRRTIPRAGSARAGRCSNGNDPELLSGGGGVRFRSSCCAPRLPWTLTSRQPLLGIDISTPCLPVEHPSRNYCADAQQTGLALGLESSRTNRTSSDDGITERERDRESDCEAPADTDGPGVCPVSDRFGLKTPV